MHFILTYFKVSRQYLQGKERESLPLVFNLIINMEVLLSFFQSIPFTASCSACSVSSLLLYLRGMVLDRIWFFPEDIILFPLNMTAPSLYMGWLDSSAFWIANFKIPEFITYSPKISYNFLSLISFIRTSPWQIFGLQ